MVRLVLWDVDHTLIETRGVGGEVYAAAFEAVTGQPLRNHGPMSGQTEPTIFRDNLRANGITDPGGYYQQFAQKQADDYTERADELRHRGRALPGAADLLAELADRADVLQTVLTGNTRQAAEIKLAAFNLDQYLNLNLGAYGTDHPERHRLVNIARTRAMNATGRTFDQTNTTVIGDTPNDITAAHEGGAHAIGIATGASTADELAAVGAEAVFPDLTHPGTIVAILGSHHR